MPMGKASAMDKVIGKTEKVNTTMVSTGNAVTDIYRRSWARF